MGWLGPPPAARERFELDGRKQNYVEKREYDFALRMRCDVATVNCARDGALIEISIEFRPNDAAIDMTAVTILAEVTAARSPLLLAYFSRYIGQVLSAV